jgi:hypothetical protein
MNADKNGDGEIDFEEFVHMMKARKRLLALVHSMRSSTPLVSEADSDRLCISQTSSLGSGRRNEFDLPMLHIPKKISKRHLIEAQYDPFFSRPTPHCLKLGKVSQTDITVLRRELEISKYGIEQLECKVKEGVAWVRSNMPVTSLKAQIFCQKWGVERFQNIFKQIQNKNLIAVVLKWKDFVAFEISKEKAQQYLKTSGTRKVTTLIRSWQQKRYLKSWNCWVALICKEIREERNAAAVELQRILRGWLVCVKLNREEQEHAALTIQNTIRGFIGRKRGEKIWCLVVQNKAATMLQRAYRGYEGRAVAKAVMQRLREENAALVIQNILRGHRDRKIFQDILHQRDIVESASKIQSLFRGTESRQKTAVLRRQSEETSAAMKIQCHLRGRIERVNLRQKKEENIAVIIVQTRTRAFLQKTAFKRTVEREKRRKHRERLNLAALLVQTRYRMHHDKFSFHLKRQAIRAEEEFKHEMEAMAATRVQSLVRGRKACRQVKGDLYELKEEKRKALAKKTREDQARFEEGCALMIQSWWRAQTAKHTMRLVKAVRSSLAEDHESHAIRLQSVWRGSHCRTSIEKQHILKNGEAQNEKLVDNAAATVQRAYRSKKKLFGDVTKAKDRQTQEDSNASVRIQSMWRGWSFISSSSFQSFLNMLQSNLILQKERKKSV